MLSVRGILRGDVAGVARYRGNEGLCRRGVRKTRRYMIQHSLDRGYEVVGVCRERSVDKPSESRIRSR